VEVLCGVALALVVLNTAPVEVTAAHSDFGPAVIDAINGAGSYVFV